VQSDATPPAASIAPAAEFAFTEQPSHSRRHVSLLCSLVLAGAISPPDAAPPDDAAPVVESSPTPAEDLTIEAADTTEAPTAVETSEPPVEVETPEAPAAVETSVAPEPAPFTGAPGGYWSVGEQHERSREPLDGEDDLTIGSVIFSLGFIRAGAGVLTIVMGNKPDLCPITQPRGCSGLRSYGWVGVAEGGLMVGTGLAYMIIGAARRDRHRRWKSGEPLALRLDQSASPNPNRVEVGPWLIPRAVGGFSQSRALAGAGLRLQLQF
jgi:hypothetical protein